MDTSKEYIKMCEKAEEIQKNNEGVSGTHIKNNIVICNYKDAGSFYWCMDIVGERENGETYVESTKSIWLPRQDQLQKMIVGSVPLGLIKVMYNRVYGIVDYKLGFDYHEKFTSMEQLWLVFVMKEKFRKVWDGKDWVKE